MVLATNERFLPARGTFRAILASESHWLQPVLVFSVRWWPTPVGVGRVLVIQGHPLCNNYYVFSALQLWVVVGDDLDQIAK